MLSPHAANCKRKTEQVLAHPYGGGELQLTRRRVLLITKC